MKILGFLFMLFFSGGLYAQTGILQSLERNVSGQGKVTIHQDEEITKLIGAHRYSSNRPSHHSTIPSAPKAEKDENGTSVVLDMDNVDEETPKTIIKVVGYRVQTYAGNNTRNAKIEAMGVASKIREYFPEIPVYTFFNPPRWLCRVGDFRSMEEAYAMMRKLKATGVFHEVSIVKDRVNVTL